MEEDAGERWRCPLPGVEGPGARRSESESACPQLPPLGKRVRYYDGVGGGCCRCLVLFIALARRAFRMSIGWLPVEVLPPHARAPGQGVSLRVPACKGEPAAPFCMPPACGAAPACPCMPSAVLLPFSLVRSALRDATRTADGHMVSGAPAGRSVPPGPIGSSKR